MEEGKLFFSQPLHIWRNQQEGRSPMKCRRDRDEGLGLWGANRCSWGSQGPTPS